jgi:putative FmdB family regulatory protein
MPTYIFTCDCGHSFDDFCSVAEMRTEAQCPQCGKLAQRDIGAEQRGGITCGERGFWKHESESMAVSDSEIAETREWDKAQGAEAASWRRDGGRWIPRFKSMTQLRNYQKANGMIDKNSYY